MTEIEFEKFQSGWRKTMIEKSTVEIRALKSTMEEFVKLYPYQMVRLIDDLKLILDYKSKGHSANEEFEKIMQGFYR